MLVDVGVVVLGLGDCVLCGVVYWVKKVDGSVEYMNIVLVCDCGYVVMMLFIYIVICMVCDLYLLIYWNLVCLNL